MTLYTLKLHDNKNEKDYKIKFYLDGKNKDKVPLTTIDLFTTSYYDDPNQIVFENKQDFIEYCRNIEKLPLSNDVKINIVYSRNKEEKELEVVYGGNDEIRYFAKVFNKYKAESMKYSDTKRRKEYYEEKIYNDPVWDKLVCMFLKMVIDEPDFKDYITIFNKTGGKYTTKSFQSYVTNYYTSRNREDVDEREVNSQAYADIRKSFISYKTLRGVCLAIDKYNHQIAYDEKIIHEDNDSKMTAYDDINQMTGGYTKLGELAEKLFAEGFLIDDIIRYYPDIAMQLGYIDSEPQKRAHR